MSGPQTSLGMEGLCRREMPPPGFQHASYEESGATAARLRRAAYARREAIPFMHGTAGAGALRIASVGQAVFAAISPGPTREVTYASCGENAVLAAGARVLYAWFAAGTGSASVSPPATGVCAGYPWRRQATYPPSSEESWSSPGSRREAPRRAESCGAFTVTRTRQEPCNGC